MSVDEKSFEASPLSKLLTEQEFLSLPPMFALLMIAFDAFRFSLMRLLGGDEALFLYGGWAWVEHGRVPYLHLWDIKPPVLYELTALFSLLTDGDQVLMYYLAVITMLIAFIGSIWLAVAIVYELTSNPFMAVLSGFLAFSYPPFYDTLMRGLRPKHLVTFLGLLTILLFIRNRIIMSTVTSVIAAGIYQFGVIFYVSVVLANYLIPDQADEIEPKGTASVVAVSVAVTVVVVAPFVAAGATVPMLEQVVVAPIVGPEGSTITLDTMWPLVIAGVVGSVLIYKYTEHFDVRSKIVSIATMLLSLQFIFGVNLGGRTDAIPIMVLSAVSVGIWLDSIPNATETVSELRQRALAERIPFSKISTAKNLLVGLFLVMSLMSLPAFNGGLDPGLASSDMRDRYWSGNVSYKCHSYMHSDHRYWLNHTAATRSDEVCGSGLDPVQLIKLVF